MIRIRFLNFGQPAKKPSHRNKANMQCLNHARQKTVITQI